MRTNFREGAMRGKLAPARVPFLQARLLWVRPVHVEVARARCCFFRDSTRLRLEVHGHLSSLYGMTVRGPDGARVFRELVEPNAEDLAELARRTTPCLVRVPKTHAARPGTR